MEFFLLTRDLSDSVSVPGKFLNIPEKFRHEDHVERQYSEVQCSKRQIFAWTFWV